MVYTLDLIKIVSLFWFIATYIIALICIEIAEYWVVNLRKRHVVFWDPQDGEYASKNTLSGGTIYPQAFPDLAISVSFIVSI